MNITFIDFIRLCDIACKLFDNKISMVEGEMISYRNIYRQLSNEERTFIKDKYGEKLYYLEDYSGVRKRKLEDLE